MWEALLTHRGAINSNDFSWEQIPESHYLGNPTQRRIIKSSTMNYQLFLALSSNWELSKYAIRPWVERRFHNDEFSSHTHYKYWDPCELAQDTVQLIQKHLRLNVHEDHSLFKQLPPHLFIGTAGQTLLFNPCSWKADLLPKEWLWVSVLLGHKLGTICYIAQPLLSPFPRRLSSLRVLILLVWLLLSSSLSLSFQPCSLSNPGSPSSIFQVIFFEPFPVPFPFPSAYFWLLSFWNWAFFVVIWSCQQKHYCRQRRDRCSTFS